MTTDEPADIVAYYARCFREGMIDLSASSPPPMSIRLGESFSVAHSSPRMPWALRQAIARRYQALGPNDILVCAGASEALAAIAHALVQRGDEVALGSDAYPSFVAAARRCGARMVTLPTGATRAWLMTNPSAPDGQWRNIQNLIIVQL